MEAQQPIVKIGTEICYLEHPCKVAAIKNDFVLFDAPEIEGVLEMNFNVVEDLAREWRIANEVKANTREVVDH